MAGGPAPVQARTRPRIASSPTALRGQPLRARSPYAPRRAFGPLRCSRVPAVRRRQGPARGRGRAPPTGVTRCSVSRPAKTRRAPAVNGSSRTWLRSPSSTAPTIEFSSRLPRTRGTYSKAPPGLRRLHHQGNGELRLVEMPTVLAAVDEDVHRACAERIRKTVETRLAEHRADEVLEAAPTDRVAGARNVRRSDRRESSPRMSAPAARPRHRPAGRATSPQDRRCGCSGRTRRPRCTRSPPRPGARGRQAGGTPAAGRAHPRESASGPTAQMRSPRANQGPRSGSVPGPPCARRRARHSRPCRSLPKRTAGGDCGPAPCPHSSCVLEARANPRGSACGPRADRREPRASPPASRSRVERCLRFSKKTVRRSSFTTCPTTT